MGFQVGQVARLKECSRCRILGVWGLGLDVWGSAFILLGRCGVFKLSGCLGFKGLRVVVV